MTVRLFNVHVVSSNFIRYFQDAMETTVEETSPVPEKKKNKKSKKKAVAEEDDFEIPSSAQDNVPVVDAMETSQDVALSENTDALTVKVPKKQKKKDRNKKNEEVRFRTVGLIGHQTVTQSSMYL